MKYKNIGTIKDISEIPFNKNLVLNGILGSGWMWRMKGKFKRCQNNKIIFEDINGCVAEVEGKIDLAILERR